MRGEAKLRSRAWKYRASILMWLLFAAIAVTLWLTLGNVFYLFNFLYIGTSLAVGLALAAGKHPHFRVVTQFLVGTYMLVFLGVIGHENMQIEGFWYYLLLGVFEGATIHYLVAKIAGPALFGRGWCGYCCWTAAILDLLPYKAAGTGRRRSLAPIRYVALAGSLALVVGLMAFASADMDAIMWWLFLAGNAAYYAVGLAMAVALRDNRAFCKYVCPVGLLMKPAAHVALLHVSCDTTACIHCGKCTRVCPMGVDVPRECAVSRRRSTECILCGKCVDACPVKALRM